MKTNDPKPYRLWRVEGRIEFVGVVAEAASFDEIIKVNRRADWRYQITCDGRPIDYKGFPILQEPWARPYAEGLIPAARVG
jgi:hypothetical protein